MQFLTHKTFCERAKNLPWVPPLATLQLSAVRIPKMSDSKKRNMFFFFNQYCPARLETFLNFIFCIPSENRQRETLRPSWVEKTQRVDSFCVFFQSQEEGGITMPPPAPTCNYDVGTKRFLPSRKGDAGCSRCINSYSALLPPLGSSDLEKSTSAATRPPPLPCTQKERKQELSHWVTPIACSTCVPAAAPHSIFHTAALRETDIVNLSEQKNSSAREIHILGPWRQKEEEKKTTPAKPARPPSPISKQNVGHSQRRK